MVKRLPRIRFSIRQLLIVVAVVSVLLGMTVVLLRRRESSRRLADAHALKAAQEHFLGRYAAEVPWIVVVRPSTVQVRTKVAHNELGGHYAALGAKYRRAADRPWLPVGADPAPPYGP